MVWEVVVWEVARGFEEPQDEPVKTAWVCNNLCQYFDDSFAPVMLVSFIYLSESSFIATNQTTSVLFPFVRFSSRHHGRVANPSHSRVFSR